MKPLDYHITIWKFCAIWLWPDQPRWYYTYCVVVWLILYISTPILQIWNMSNATDIFELMDAMYVLPSTLMAIKIAILWKNKPNITKFFKLSDRIEIELKSNEFRKLFRQSELRILRLLRSLAIWNMYSATMIFIAAQKAGNHQLMWNFKLPFKIDGSELTYQLTICIQYVILLPCVMLISSSDGFACTFYALLTTHLDILARQLQSLGMEDDRLNKIEMRLNAPKPFQLRAMKQAQLRQNVIKLKKCIQYHYICNQLSSYTDHTTSNYNVLQFGMSSISLCCAIFQAYFNMVSRDYKYSYGTKTIFSYLQQNSTPELFRIIASIQMIVCFSIQLYVPCYYASILTEKSNELSTAIYNCNWIEQSPEFKKLMLTFVESNKKPIIPRAGGLFEVGLPMFVRVYSFL